MPPTDSATPPVPATVILTGAGRGIGRAVARDLAEATSASLVLISRSASAEATAADCNKIRPGSARSMVWDLADWKAGASTLASTVAAAAGPVALVHAAGVLGPTGDFVGNDLDAWWQAMEVNLGAGVRLTQAVLGRMVADKAGRIVLFAGGGAAYGYPRFSSYGTAKAALVRFTETLAMELGNDGPTITIIAPGANDTDMLAEVQRAGGIVKTTVSIDEPCRLVRRLLTEDARGLNGRFVHVRDTWDAASATALGEDHWRLRRVQ
jgi:NAD(P)-dependent dehydrogenase (short-subunit alcohol dehydrogenase family)